MSINPYSPPQTDLTTPAQPSETLPALWNPNAAALWSLLFSPIFGALIHMKNWQALGQPDKAAQSKMWAIGVAAFFFLTLVAEEIAPENKPLALLSRFGPICLLIAWYGAMARDQINFVSMSFQPYPKRGWGTPFLYVLLTIVAIFVVAAVAGLAYGALIGAGLVEGS